MTDLPMLKQKTGLRHRFRLEHRTEKCEAVFG